MFHMKQKKLQATLDSIEAKVDKVLLTLTVQKLKSNSKAKKERKQNGI